METNTDKLIATKDNGIGWIIFNNPARHNAVSFEMWQALPDLLEAYVKDPEVRGHCRGHGTATLLLF